MIEARRAEIADRIAGLHALDAKLAGLQGHLGRPRRSLAVIDGPCRDAADAVIGAVEGGCAVLLDDTCRRTLGRSTRRVSFGADRAPRRADDPTSGTAQAFELGWHRSFANASGASASLRDTDRDGSGSTSALQLLGLKQPLRHPSALDGKKVPSARDALELVRTAIIEVQSRPDDEVLDRARDKDLAGPGLGRDPCSDVGEAGGSSAITSISPTWSPARISSRDP